LSYSWLFQIPCLLVGNKVDLSEKRQVSKEQGEQLAGALKCRFIETSISEPGVYRLTNSLLGAKTKLNVENAFMQLAEMVVARAAAKVFPPSRRPGN
jgi:GTPase SAR1 family protein